MIKEFIPYEQALDLKELAFDEPCFTSYNGRFLDFKIWNDDGCEASQINVNMNVGQCPNAPTFSQAFRWFREKHDLDYALLPESSSGYRLLDRTFNIVIYKYYMNMNVQSEIIKINGEIVKYVNKDNAELECLKKLIEIVKEKI
jgi:hypothetical protein